MSKCRGGQDGRERPRHSAILAFAGLALLAASVLAAAGCFSPAPRPAETGPREARRAVKCAVLLPLRLGSAVPEGGTVEDDPAHARLVRAVTALSAEPDLDFVLVLGNVIAAGPHAREALDAVRNLVATLPCPIYGVAGEEEVRAGLATDVLRVLAAPRRRAGQPPPASWGTPRAWPPPEPSAAGEGRSYAVTAPGGMVLIGLDTIGADPDAPGVPEGDWAWSIDRQEEASGRGLVFTAQGYDIPERTTSSVEEWGVRLLVGLDAEGDVPGVVGTRWLVDR